MTKGAPTDPTTGAPRRNVPLSEIRAAAERIRGRVHRTPLLSSRTAARVVAEKTGVRLGDGGHAGLGGGLEGGQPRLFFKAEHLQVTGSFKVRGATNKLATLSQEERARGLIAISAGNHAMAVAYAAAMSGTAVTVVMPAVASRAKVDAARSYGAEVVLFGDHVGDTFRKMEELRDERGLTFIHPFNDAAVIAGQGTAGLELVEDLRDLDVVVVGVGGGGLISGISAAVKQLRPSARLIGIEPERSNALSLGLAAGVPVDVTPVSMADGLGAPFAGAWTIDLARRYVDEVLLVDEATIARGVRFALERMKQLLEPAGAAALGAVLGGRVALRDGENVAVVLSGGNVDLARLPDILAVAEG